MGGGTIVVDCHNQVNRLPLSFPAVTFSFYGLPEPYLSINSSEVTSKYIEIFILDGEGGRGIDL